MTKDRAALRTAGAIVLGAVLALLPFARYAFHPGHAGAHADHQPRHGGVLGMAGDLHLELVRAEDKLAVYPTDAYRRPVHLARGHVMFDDGPPVPLVRHAGRWTAQFGGACETVTCTATLPDGAVVELTFDCRGLSALDTPTPTPGGAYAARPD